MCEHRPLVCRHTSLHTPIILYINNQNGSFIECLCLIPLDNYRAMHWIGLFFLLLFFRSPLFDSSKSVIIRKDFPLLTADQLSFVISLSEC